MLFSVKERNILSGGTRWYDEINDFVSFIQNAARGGSAREMAIVFVGEPGNGKTFFIDYVCYGGLTRECHVGQPMVATWPPCGGSKFV